MNKYQQVLDKFINDGHRLTHRERNEFGIVLQELVDKATPKKTIKEPIIRNGYRLYKNYCPLCNQELLILGNYCLHCGQAVDWSNEK